MKTCFIQNVLIYTLSKNWSFVKKESSQYCKKAELSSLKKLISLLVQEAEKGDRY